MLTEVVSCWMVEVVDAVGTCWTCVGEGSCFGF